MLESVESDFFRREDVSDDEILGTLGIVGDGGCGLGRWIWC